jgi:UDP-N-acetyl-D-mannosaminuronic acid dehydrogenase
MEHSFSHDLCVIGGAGHVGLPFALLCADSGLQTVVFDTNDAALDKIRKGEMPFVEEGAEPLLRRLLPTGKLRLENRPDSIADCHILVLIIGTPVDEHLNPSLTAIDRVIETARPFLRDGQVMILRSTVFPGTSERIQRRLHEWGLDVGVACCPERVAQGQSLREFRELPQLVSAFDDRTRAAVREFFGRLGPELVELEPIEAELCKLMTNSWRYISFATVNQFYMLASAAGLDFSRILHGCRHNYPRMKGMPGPGLAAGPCLMKDSMQLAAFSHNHFMLGHAAMLVNEGLPSHLIEQVQEHTDLSQATVGILGMAFKAESDDPRDSLSYKLRKLLQLEARKVICTDPYVTDPTLVPLEQVLQEADVLFVATPHARYRQIQLRPNQRLVDVWNCVSAPSL